MAQEKATTPPRQLWEEEIRNVPYPGNSEFTHSAPPELLRIGAVCEGLNKIKLDAIQSILTDGQWLFQTAMGADEMQKIQQELQISTGEILEPVDTEALVVVEGDSSLEDMNAHEASLHFREKGFITVDSLQLSAQLEEANHPQDEQRQHGASASPDEVSQTIRSNIAQPSGTAESAPRSPPGTSTNNQPSTPPTIEVGTSERVVIFANDIDSPWDTLVDENTVADEQPPPAKKAKRILAIPIRPKPPRVGNDCTASDSPALLRALEEAQVRHAIQTEGIAQHHKVSEWRKKNRGVSIHILHDGLLTEWPTEQDKKCVLTVGRGTLKQWSDKIRSAEIRIRGHSTVIVLEQLRELTATCALKNKISTLVRAIRSARPDMRVYICDGIQTGHNHVLGLPPARHNQVLHDSLVNLHITHDLHKVFYVGMSSHFPDIARQRQLAVPGQLTRLGCMHYRAHLFRELGLTKFTL